MFNEKNEIMGDLLDEIAEAELDFADPREPDPDPASDEAMEAHYRDWCRREGITPEEQAEADSIREWDWNERPWAD
jgi:hypothetical protein